MFLISRRIQGLFFIKSMRSLFKNMLFVLDFKESQIFSTYLSKTRNIKYHENPSYLVEVFHAGRGTDTVLLAAFHRFANAPKILSVILKNINTLRNKPMELNIFELLKVILMEMQFVLFNPINRRLNLSSKCRILLRNQNWRCFHLQKNQQLNNGKS